MSFNLAAVRYSLVERALEIYVSGCLGKNGVRCKGCHNPEIWDPEVGRPWESYKNSIENSIFRSGGLVRSIRIYGGELLDKPVELVEDFLSYFSGFGKPLWLFTRFELNEVPKSILASLEYIKCGMYDESAGPGEEFYGVKLATANQKIYKKGVDF